MKCQGNPHAHRATRRNLGKRMTIRARISGNHAGSGSSVCVAWQHVPDQEGEAAWVLHAQERRGTPAMVGSTLRRQPCQIVMIRIAFISVIISF
jgi:hypothetical protein